MSIKVSEHGSTVTAHPMLVQNVATFSGMHGMFKNSVHPHAFIAKRFAFMCLRTIVEVQDLSQVGTIANRLEFALP